MTLRDDLVDTLKMFLSMGNDKEALQVVALAWMLNKPPLDFDVNAVIEEVTGDGISTKETPQEPQ